MNEGRRAGAVLLGALCLVLCVVSGCRSGDMKIIRKPKNTPPFTGGDVPDDTHFESTVEIDGTLTASDGVEVTGNVVASGAVIARGGVEVGTGAQGTVAGPGTTVGSGDDGGDLSLTGGASDPLAASKISGAIVFETPMKVAPQTYAGAGPFTMDPTKPFHVGQSNFAPTVFNLPPLDGSVNVGGRIFFFRATGGGGKAFRLTPAAGDTIEGSSSFFALPTGGGFLYAIFWADIANRNWVQLG